MCFTYSPNGLWDSGAGRDDRLRGPLWDGRVQALGLVIGRRSIVVVPVARVVVVGRSRLQRGGDIVFYSMCICDILYFFHCVFFEHGV